MVSQDGSVYQGFWGKLRPNHLPGNSFLLIFAAILSALYRLFLNSWSKLRIQISNRTDSPVHYNGYNRLKVAENTRNFLRFCGRFFLQFLDERPIFDCFSANLPRCVHTIALFFRWHRMEGEPCIRRRSLYCGSWQSFLRLNSCCGIFSYLFSFPSFLPFL